MGIRWGVRARTMDGAAAAGKAGFAYVQLPIEAVAGLPAAALAEAATRSGVSFESFEAPLPKGVAATEPGFNIYHWTEYTRGAMARLADLGCKTLSWGDGKARLLPVEGEVASAKERFYQFMFMLCDSAAKYGIVVCLEPLGPKRTNFLNSVSEAAKAVELIGKPNLGVAAGMRSMVENGAKPADLAAYAGLIRHAHLESPAAAATLAPPSPADGHDYRGFVGGLAAIGYAGLVVLPEGSDAEALRFCRGLEPGAAPGGNGGKR